MSETASGLSLLAAAARNTRKKTHLRYNPQTLRRILYHIKASVPHSKLYTIRIHPNGSKFKVSYKRDTVDEVNDDDDEENAVPVARSINKYVIGRPDIQKGRYITKLEFYDVVTSGNEETDSVYVPSTTGIPPDPLLIFLNPVGANITDAIVSIKEDPKTNGSTFSMRKQRTRRLNRRLTRNEVRTNSRI